MTVPDSMLEIPLYANKPQRRVPGTNVVAVTTYRSEDKTVQTVTLITEDGQTMIGRLHYQHRQTMTRSRGWSLHQCPTSAQYCDQWPTLAEAAFALAERLGCADKVEAR
jgi:hypothetical protein